MALIVITVQDGPGGATVSFAAEPVMNMAEPAASPAQELVHRMLGALPINPPQEPETRMAEGEVAPEPEVHIDPTGGLSSGPHGPIGEVR